ncbi:MAG: low specificity L-threonine aldolase [Acidobacteriota bacterium]
MRSFASDNGAGVHPKIMAAMAEANRGHALAYGSDPWTERATETMRDALEAPEAEVLFVYNGTGANVITLGSLLHSHEAVVCAVGAHLDVDECGAPERVVGCKILPVEAPGAKLTPDLVAERLTGRGVEHHVQPRLVSITQATEVGRVYTPEQLRSLADFAHEQDLLLHMDGARISNAAAALGCSFADITTHVGVDAVSFGGTKNGLMFGEAVVFLRPELAGPGRYQRKQTTQLASKLRFIAAQFSAFFEGELWRENASQANTMARRLADGLVERGVELVEPVEANGVFARIEPGLAESLRETHFFYDWRREHQEVRLMCSFDTAADDVDSFLAALDRLSPSG